MTRRPMSPAHRRYVVSVMLLMGGYVAILVGVGVFFRNSAPTGASAFVAALLPALPIVGVFVAMGRLLVEEPDEYRRMLLVRQCLIAIAFALSIATLWGFLEEFDQVPHVPSYWAAILFFAGLGIGSGVNWLTRPRGGDEQ